MRGYFLAGFGRGMEVGNHQDLKAERALSTPRDSAALEI
jgi:hypothetical protein